MKPTSILTLLILLTSTLAFANTPFTAPPTTASSRPSPTLIDPAASKTLDTEDLINNLTGISGLGSASPQSPAAKLHEITARMNQSSSRLSDKDPGHATQEVQSRIIASLDTLIDQLKQNENKKPNPSNSSAPASPQPAQPVSAQATAGSSPATSSNPKPGSPAAFLPSKELEEIRTQAMTLPYKDRAAILNGLSESCLPEYKEEVRKYYQALAELGKSRQNP